MSRPTFIRGLAALGLAAGVCFALAAVPSAGRAEPEKGDKPAYRLSGPFTHENVTLFLIHGEDAVKGKTFLTLDEALEQKKVIVHETKEVNNLSVENVSENEEVFIQAGDIVKGGQQDRVLAFDLIVPPKSGKVPVASFCVEHGRWSVRGKEDAAAFASSKNALNSNELKLACRMAASQRLVWDRVAKSQDKLENKVGGSVKAPQSETSLELTLDHKKVVEAVDAYAKKLGGSIDGKDDVIGYVLAVNGKPHCADVYATSALFKKLWPKLLKAAAVEAVAEFQKDKKFPEVTADEIKAFLADTEKGKKTEKEVGKRFTQVQQEAEKSILFETCDREQKGAVLRRSYVAK
jgi:hypothetical protein